ncbi:hypothetical protein H8S17_11360 [Roseburia sp. BX1005]|uniref:Transmembrane protein n=1 Tax=Roseburia zhanii TaxID=2763064 RepID=A0A923RW02_9FIRM|nr:hypothetical protein [Roseburia zhanii]MBC5714789.1 hypothetical protein [Roseburia zhanii]
MNYDRKELLFTPDSVTSNDYSPFKMPLRSSLRLKWRVLGCGLGFPVVSLMCLYTVVVPPAKNEGGEGTHYENKKI